ncbi:MAG TPA: ECF transporter S component [Chloroflexota bacterium]|jgi:energy-coupling factor transport system substrate-specific component
MATTIDEVKPVRSRGWRTLDAVLVAVLAVVFGFLYMQWVPVWLAAASLGAQIGQEALFGFWLIAGVLASYIIRRPGAALVGEFLAALAEVLFGAAAGTPLLVTGLMQGLGAELVFGARRWRDYSLTTIVLAGAVAMLVALPWNWYRLGYFQLNPGFLVVLLVVRLLSGAILSGLVSKLIGDALARTGVLNNFALGRERQEIV